MQNTETRTTDRATPGRPALPGFSGGAKNKTPALPGFSGGAKNKTPALPGFSGGTQNKTPALPGFSGGALNKTPALPGFSGGAQSKTPAPLLSTSFFGRCTKNKDRPERDSNPNFIVSRH